MLSVGSLFTGCMGLDLGLESTGEFRVAWTCENDTACRRIIAERRPELPLYADVRDLLAIDPEPVDVLAGGFPCQDLSQAGRRQGLEGDRSGLWHAMGDAVRVFRPRLVLVENVAGLAHRGQGRVLYDLAESGYVGRWLRLRSSDVGAPHLRERLFIFAVSDADDAGRREHGGPVAASTEYAAAEHGRRAAPDAGGERLDRPGGADPEGATAALGLGNGRARAARPRTPTPDADGGRRESGRVEEPVGLVGAYRREFDGRGPVREFDDGAAVEWGEYEPAVRRWERELGRRAPRPADDMGRLEPEFVEWMLGFPHEWTVGERRSSRLRMLGNSVQVQVGAVAGRLLLDLERGRHDDGSF